MSTADWFVLGIVALAGIYGFARGLVRGALSLAGFALGAYLGARLAPAVLSDGSPYAPLIALGAALLAGTFLSGLAEMLGVTLRSTLGAVPGLRAVDSVAGGLLGAAAGVVLCWALGAVLLYLPGQSSLREAVQESAILSRINEEFPPERLLETLERVDPIGVLVGPPAEVPPPDTKLTRDADVRRAAESVVRITGTACGLGVEGSGWIVRRGWVVTNAHVIAGIDRPRVDRRDENDLTSAVMAIDVKNDLAVLRVPGLRGRPLRFAEPETRSPGRAHGLPRERAAADHSRAPRRYERLRQPRCLRRGAGDADRDRDPRDRAAGSVGWARASTPRGRVRTTVFARRPGESGGYGIPPEPMRKVLARATAGGAAVVSDCAR